MDKMTGEEFVRLAHTAKGFGHGGRYTLVEWLDSLVAQLLVVDAIGDMQATLGDMTAALERTPLSEPTNPRSRIVWRPGQPRPYRD